MIILVPCSVAAVSKTSPKSSGDPEYVYDHRGLKVRKDSLPRVRPAEQEEERKKKTPSKLDL